MWFGESAAGAAGAEAQCGVGALQAGNSAAGGDRAGGVVGARGHETRAGGQPGVQRVFVS